ncbi:MAG: glycine cleavage system protein GcvH [Phycisphaerae bacterium]|nr:glycine cleavage system protein GcvH [Phycisphaerae bacterium]MDW8262270.1 glycine cleavage system protein GcvH [Phycisphaerales bacterium]
MSIPGDRTYLETHEWHKIEGDTVVIGISQIAVDQLTDITFVSLPKVGTKLSAGQRFGEIESVKATSDLYSGVAGEVVAVNETLANDPGAINRDPYAEGWMIKVKPDDINQAAKLLSGPEYAARNGH